ncbi:hypothetical protein KUTeg_006314 [Tegillarca granosa]|uniref:EGF-like domain-containing protein n=1 Tax=Tegillarca granosa TaxID=220873 RepID=A0ABQ9FJ51_TEGGR|nr:hypothetical protein KUTeg_006314 [Tegillarca granosa]
MTVAGDECVSNPCQNGGQCIDNVNSFTCNCPSGYTGSFCEAWDEVAVCSAKCGAAICRDDFQNGNFTCMCPNDQVYGGNTCSQINHCMSNPCHNGGTCTNRYGGYTCTCKPGNANPDCLKFVYECASNPCKNGGTCQDGQNDYSFYSGFGYTGKNCDDIPNNCTPNPCHPNNTASACQELVNDFICPCKEGYYGKTCSEGNVNCNSFPCFHNATCTPTSDGYNCQCAVGWTGTHCETEIDKCTSLTPCQNGATCVNIVNDYICRYVSVNLFEWNYSI